jgi:hypothetical protein
MGWLLLFSRLLLRLDEWMESEVRGIGYGNWDLGEFGSIAIATTSLEASISSACTGNHSRSLCLAGIREYSMKWRGASLSCISRVFSFVRCPREKSYTISVHRPPKVPPPLREGGHR